MSSKLPQKDILAFLEIDTAGLNPEALESLRSRLETDAKEYIFYRLCSGLTIEQMEQVLQNKTGQDMLNTMQQIMPDFTARSRKFLNEFKEQVRGNNG